jgi:thioester reductase-like protein
LDLHCEVKADNHEAARNQVEQIPNLMEWREISAAELAEIIKNERALASTKG